MITNNKPHILNLKARLKVAFRDACDHANMLYYNQDDGGEEKIYLTYAREFMAGLSLLDEMVQHDRFRMLVDLKQSENTLLKYREMLNDGSYELQSRQITGLLKEISAVEAKVFRS